MSSDPKAADRDSLYESFARAPSGEASSGDAPGQGGAAPGAPPKPVPAMYCSECRSLMRTYYYALNERPVCGKCKGTYETQIALGTGPKAFRRAALHGLGAAALGAALLGALVLITGFYHVIFAIGIGYLVGKTVMKATGGYGGRRYQFLAVGLTYFAIGAGALTPVVKAVADLDEQPAQVTESSAAEPGEEPDPLADVADAMAAAELPAIAEEEDAPEPSGAVMSDAERAASLSRRGFFGVFVGLLVLLVTLPLLSLFAYGITGAVVGILGFGYGMHKAWTLTDGQGLDLQLSGPHRVGTGPIAPAL